MGGHKTDKAVVIIGNVVESNRGFGSSSLGLIDFPTCSFSATGAGEREKNLLGRSSTPESMSALQIQNALEYVVM